MRIRPLLSLALLAAPRALLACPVCIGSNDQNAVAFAATTTFLSLLPVLMVAALVTYLRRRARRQDEPLEADAGTPR